MTCEGFNCQGNWWQRFIICLQLCKNCSRTFCERCLFEEYNEFYCSKCLIFGTTNKIKIDEQRSRETPAKEQKNGGIPVNEESNIKSDQDKFKSMSSRQLKEYLTNKGIKSDEILAIKERNTLEEKCIQVFNAK